MDRQHERFGDLRLKLRLAIVLVIMSDPRMNERATTVYKFMIN